MGWFLTGVWSTILVVMWILALLNGATGGIVLITIFMIITSLCIGLEEGGKK